MIDIPKNNEFADLVYKNTPQRDLMLTFFPPYEKRFEKSPVYFIISGGGWHTETRQSMIDFSIESEEILRKEGYAVVSIDYRVCKEGVVMHEIITDCFDAARYISHYADVLEIDSDNFVMSGHSAGAHLALMLSYANPDDFKDGYEFDDRFKVKSVAAMSPPTALYDRSTYHLLDIAEVFNDYNDENETKSGSPICYISENCPPTLLCAGTSDYLVFANSSEMVYNKLTECGVKSKLVLSVGGGHCFEKIHDEIEPSVSMSEIQKIIAEFILGC